MQSVAGKPGEGTPSPRGFNRGVHRRLLKSVGAYRTVSWILRTMGLEVNNLLRLGVRTRKSRTQAASVRPDGTIEWPNIRVFRVCRVRACYWNVERFRVTRSNAGRAHGQRAGCPALRLAVLATAGCSAPAALPLPAVHCWQGRSSAVSVRCLDSPRSPGDHCDRNFCSPPQNSLPGDPGDDRPDALPGDPRDGRLDVHHAVLLDDRCDALLPFRCVPLPHRGGTHPVGRWRQPPVGRDSPRPTVNDPLALYVRARSALAWLQSDARAPPFFRARFRELEFRAAHH